MIFFDDAPRKRTLGVRDRQILYRNANKHCENPACKKAIDFDEMQVGHKTAFSKGGSTTLANSACLCYRCNKLQGTDSWTVFLRKQKVVDPVKANKDSVKKGLQALSVAQLKALATKHGIKVQGKLVDDWFESRRAAPTKSQYITKLSSTLKPADLKSIPKPPVPKARPKAKNKVESETWW